MPTVSDPAWANALNLEDRCAACAASSPPEPAPLGAEERFRRWCAASGLEAHSELLGRRLAAAGLTEEKLVEFLGTEPAALQFHLPQPPWWLPALDNLFPDPGAGDGASDAGPVPDDLGLPAGLEPFTAEGRKRLRQTLLDLDGARERLDVDHLAGQLLADLRGQLLKMASRTFILELNVARLQGELPGDTPEERFKGFVARLGRPDVRRTLFREYPVLARQLLTAVEQWHAACREILERLLDDREALIRELNGGQDAGRVVEVRLGAGDRHGGGRTVAICKFEIGFSVVYKPRSLAVEAHFQQLLAWLNERGMSLPFRVLKVLERGAYGWAEFVPHLACNSRDEVTRFYARQGGNLAVLYALDAIDVHSDNLIACGEHPVIVDVESLFHPTLRRKLDAAGPHKALELLATSVLRTGLLPERLGVSELFEGADLSALGARAGQLTPTQMPVYREAGTDTMRLVREHLRLPGRLNRPSLDGRDVNVLDFMDSFLAGFTSTYRLLMENRTALLAAEGPLAAFQDDEVRVLLRATRVYGALLDESFHPNLLRDALDRERLFDRLWLEVESRPELERVVESERGDLWRNDVPIFGTRPGERHLWAPRERQFTDFFPEPGLERARRRIVSLDEGDLDLQLWFARSSLATLAGHPLDAHWPSYLASEGTGSADPEELRREALAIAGRLEQLAVREDGEATWFGLVSGPDGRHGAISPLGPDLYDGLAGVALFLAQAGELPGGERFSRLAREAVAGLLRLSERAQPNFELIGAYSGWGGLIYTLAYLAALWRDPELAAAAESCAEALERNVDRDVRWDLMSGSAGAILGLLRLQRASSADRWITVAARCGDRLLSHARSFGGGGLGWPHVEVEERALAGMSHGTAGIAWALCELSEATGDGRYAEAARGAIAYERTLFSPQAGNWRDLRRGEDGGFPTAWCHGASGIGLARALSPGLLDGEVREEILTAVETTFVKGFGNNHSLCHGDLGNAGALLTIALRLGDSALAERVRRVADSVRDGMRRYGWLTGVPLAIENPGLMTGLAGIGYGLLRLADPAGIPCILSLELPAVGPGGLEEVSHEEEGVSGSSHHEVNRSQRKEMEK